MSHRLTIAAIILLAALGMTLVFWLPLWLGGGFVGGDVYSYYFPQKVFFAEQLHAGEFPLWNNRTGFGYPLIGESQTGAFYPLHLFWYYFFDVNTAYNAEHVLHYTLAFLFATMFALRFGLNLIPSLFAGLIYTYAWFPSRCCVEWAIIDGAWLPAALWCAESFLQIRFWRYAIGLSIVLAIQMLAGHFQIAFMTQLLLLAYIPLRLWFTEDIGINQEVSQVSELDRTQRILNRRSANWSAVISLSVAMFLGFAMAAVQLLPSWELKQNSQRAEAGEHHQLDFGSIPAWYWSQTIRPWHWYSRLVDRNQELRNSPPGENARTHEIEAHLYFGIIPFVLAFMSIGTAIVNRNRKSLIWLCLGALSLCYTPGWFLPITQHLPGFSFFQGPGRFGIITTFSVAILAADALNQFLTKPSFNLLSGLILIAAIVSTVISIMFLQGDAMFFVEQNHAANPFIFGRQPVSEKLVSTCLSIWIGSAVIGFFLDSRENSNVPSKVLNTGKVLFCCALFAVTISDLWIVSRLITTSFLVNDPPINHLATSPVRKTLNSFEKESEQSARLFAPFANFPNVLGVSSLPVYLTFGPKEYPEIVEPALEHRTVEEDASPLDDARLKLFADWGVTHILEFKPFSPTLAPLKSGRIQLIWQGTDPVINRAMGRFGQPLYLYQLTAESFLNKQTRGRIQQIGRGETDYFEVAEFRANKIIVESSLSGDDSLEGHLVLTDLIYPGWSVTIDGKPAKSIRQDRLFRSVKIPAGKHTVVWKYEPGSVYWGAIISLLSVFIIATIAHVRFWHPHFFQKRNVQN